MLERQRIHYLRANWVFGQLIARSHGRRVCVLLICRGVAKAASQLSRLSDIN